MPTTSNLSYLIRRAAALNGLFTFTAFAFWLIGCWETPASGSEAMTSEAIATEGKGEVLYLYTALDTNEAKIYIRAFEEESGIQVRWVRLSAGEVLVRIRSERTNHRSRSGLGDPPQSLSSLKAKVYSLLIHHALILRHPPAHSTKVTTGQASTSVQSVLRPTQRF